MTSIPVQIYRRIFLIEVEFASPDHPSFDFWASDEEAIIFYNYEDAKDYIESNQLMSKRPRGKRVINLEIKEFQLNG